VSYAIAYASQLAGDPVRCFTVRKAPKAHGSAKRIEGGFVAGDRVVVIEDTITTGGSALNAVDAVLAEGGSVVGVYALVDREEGGRDAIAARGLPVVAFTTARELLTHVP
jgi:orotate phosphoribosyltransferase